MPSQEEFDAQAKLFMDWLNKQSVGVKRLPFSKQMDLYAQEPGCPANIRELLKGMG